MKSNQVKPLLPLNPALLAPLAGVSDHPFRRICAENGADLTYVEMISAAALVHDSQRTLRMLERHPAEEKLGVQITGRTAKETAQAVAILDKMSFETIDINMGCPVRKVVKTGCGSAILQDVERVYETVARSRDVCSGPLSVKIRTGWDKKSINAVEVGLASAKGGADWLTIHGRTRQADYSVPVDLETIAAVKSALEIPVYGNGNIFCQSDQETMVQAAGVDGVMVSRGSLGNPWVFDQIKGRQGATSLSDWHEVVIRHLRYQEEAYGDRDGSTVRMRKHLLWYTKGWLGAKKIKQEINAASTLVEAERIVAGFAEHLQQENITQRQLVFGEPEDRFLWNPTTDIIAAEPREPVAVTQ